MKKLLAIILVMLMALMMFAGCGKDDTTTVDNTSSDSSSSSSDASSDKEDTSSASSDETVVTGPTKIVVGIGGDPGSLKPWASNSVGRIGVLPSLYQPLFTRDGFGGELMPVLASGYDIIDELTYNVNLYDYIVDTAGNPLTASDVVFSYDQAVAVGGRAAAKVTAYIESYEAIDDYTVQFKFYTDPMAKLDLIEDLFGGIYIVTQASYEASGDEMAINAVGTTPYALTNYTVGSTLTLEKVEYWQTDESAIMSYYGANVDEIEFQVVTEKAQMAIALQTGTIDMTNFVAESDIQLFEEGGQSADDFVVYKAPQNLTYFMLPNCGSDSVLSNLNLRLAVLTCVNVDNLIKGALNGNAVAVYTFGNSKFPDYQDKWESDGYYDYDLDAAKAYLDAYLAETGKAAADVNIKLIVANESYQALMAELVQASVMQLGIGCELIVNDQATTEEMVKDPTTWDLRVGMMAGGEAIAYVWSSQLDINSATTGSTINFIDDAQLQSMMDTVLTVSGHTEANMDELQKYIVENGYVRGLCQGFDNFVYANFITDVVIDQRMNFLPGSCTYDWSMAD